jgi:hypothetical protein
MKVKKKLTNLWIFTLCALSDFSNTAKPISCSEELLEAALEGNNKAKA